MSTPEFHVLVTKSLKPKGKVGQETCREIADHLLDVYENALLKGLTPEEAEQQAVGQLQSPARLRRQIRRAQGGAMRDIFRKVLLPGVISAFPLGIYGIVLEQVVGFRSPAYFFWGHAAFVFYWYMMPAFLVAGILGAWCSQRQGGSVLNRLCAGTFLAILNFLMFTVPLPLAFIIDRHVPLLSMAQAYAGYMLSQVIVPGIPMLLGTLPFLFLKDTELPQHAATA